MELNDRISVLVQGVELVQKSGGLSLDDAYLAKLTINKLNEGQYDTESINLLLNIVERGRKLGVFTFQDAHYIYLAINKIDEQLSFYLQQKEIENKKSTKKDEQE